MLLSQPSEAFKGIGSLLVRCGCKGGLTGVGRRRAFPANVLALRVTKEPARRLKTLRAVWRTWSGFKLGKSSQSSEMVNTVKTWTLPLLLRKENIKGHAVAAQQTKRTDATWSEPAPRRRCRKSRPCPAEHCQAAWGRCKRQLLHSGRLWWMLGICPAQSTSAIIFWEWLLGIEENLEEINKNEKKVWPVRLRRISNIATHSSLWLLGVLLFLTDTLQKHWKNLPRIEWNHFQNEPKKTLPGTAYKC